MHGICRQSKRKPIVLEQCSVTRNR